MTALTKTDAINALLTYNNVISFLMMSRVATVELKVTNVRSEGNNVHSVAFRSAKRKKYGAANGRSERD
ncbi:hypothetical protein [Marinobacter sp. KMM 10035]|uniref:hypothetical protein n=1 Tax=Marinobacter sp. KMM 10035 TaxID=3134034 RepID=UPI00397C17C5